MPQWSAVWSDIIRNNSKQLCRRLCMEPKWRKRICCQAPGVYLELLLGCRYHQNVLQSELYWVARRRYIRIFDGFRKVQRIELYRLGFRQRLVHRRRLHKADLRAEYSTTIANGHQLQLIDLALTRPIPLRVVSRSTTPSLRTSGTPTPVCPHRLYRHQAGQQRVFHDDRNGGVFFVFRHPVRCGKNDQRAVR